MIRLAAVSYLNTKPFLAGLEASGLSAQLKISLEVPAQCAERFRSGEADVALVPVGSLLDLDAVHLVDGYCIGADGQVDSVFLFANLPVHQIEKVYLDSHSRTSNGLTRILMRDHWHNKVQYLAEAEYVGKIGGTSAGVVIGDKAVPLRDRFRYVYDLAFEWKQLTGLPFAFAVWVYNPERVSAHQLTQLKASFELGLSRVQPAAERWAAHFGLTPEKAFWYLTACIDYRFDARKQLALTRYLTRLAELEAESLPNLTIA